LLTDIFATRYSERPIWKTIEQADRVLLVQCFRNVAEQVMPYWRDGKADESNKKLWGNVESRLSMELGLQELSPRTYGYYNPQNVWISGTWPTDKVCKDWVLAEFKQGMEPDRFAKERVSFIELAFRERASSLANERNVLELMVQRGLYTLPHAESKRRENKTLLAQFNNHCNELNERFRRAGVPLSYHNGFIQFTSDKLVEDEIVQPFWEVVSDKKWENVSIDMAEAIDRRDTGGRDPAFYAAKALESVIKIVSDDKSWTRGTEKGAANYIDNLVAERNGARFVGVWEKDLLIAFFSKVRNQFGHGPGGEPMPNLSEEQTSWAIECAMSWCKSLIERHRHAA
jgi:AbiJ N-terminal domain 4